MNKVIAVTLGAIIAMVLITYGSFALYEGSWSLAAHNQQHQNELNQKQANADASIAISGWSYQSMLGQQITKGIDNVVTDSTEIYQAKSQGLNDYANSLKSQRENDANTVCDEAQQINNSLPQGKYQTNWINKNCLGGSVNPSSVYYYAGN